MWPHPIPHTLPGGQPCQLLLLHVEGADGGDTGSHVPTQLLALALLLSPVLLHTHTPAAEEGAVDRLGGACEAARELLRRTGDSAPAAPRRLVWLLRDWRGDPCDTPSLAAYLERQVLGERPGPPGEPGAAARNQARAAIKSFFHVRDCVVLAAAAHPGPGGGREQLPRSATVQDLDSLAALLLRRAPHAAQAAQHTAGAAAPAAAPLLSGPRLAALAAACCAALNAGAGGPSQAGSTGQACGRALEAAVALYRGRLAASGAEELGPEGLGAAHTAALAEAEAALWSQCAPAEAAALLSRLRSEVGAAAGPLRAAVAAEAEARTEGWLAEAGREYVQALRSEPPDLAAAEAALHAALRALGADARCGAGRFTKAAELLAGVALPALRHRAEGWAREVAARRQAEAGRPASPLRTATPAAAEADAARQLAAAKAGAEAAESEAAALRARLAAVTAEAEARARREELESASLRSELAVARAQLAAAEAEAGAREAARRAAVARLEVAAATEAELRRQLAVLQHSPAPTPAVAAAGAAVTPPPPPQPSVGAGGGAAAGPTAEVTSPARKRGRRDAGLRDEEDEDEEAEAAAGGSVDADMEEAEPAAAAAGATEADQAAGAAWRRRRAPAAAGRRRTRRPAAAAAGVASAGEATPAAAAAAAAAVATAVGVGGGSSRLTTPQPPAAERPAAGGGGEGDVGGGGSQRTPFSSERLVLRTTPGGSAARSPGAAIGAGVGVRPATPPRPPLPPNADKMKVSELKEWLARGGFEADVFAAAASRPPPGRKEWLALLRSKCGPPQARTPGA